MAVTQLILSLFLSGVAPVSTQPAPVTPYTSASEQAPSEIASRPTQEVEVQVNFSKLSGLRVGAPVFLGGQKVGKVSKVTVQKSSPKRADRRMQKATFGDFAVSISIDSRSCDSLREGTVALISSPVVSAKAAPQTSVQLLPPRARAQKLQSGSALRGFSSYQEYWSAGTSSKS